MAPRELEPGHVLGGRFAVVGLLGTGGTASVYLVVDQLRGERVALKVVHPHLASDPSVQRRIRKEIAAASLLATDTVLAPRELHELDGLLCLTLPYHAGQTLAEHVAANGPLQPEAVRELGVRVATALGQAHRQGLLHRDVTANNVMVDHGRDAMLMDFGLARAESSTTRSTGLLGTTGFAAPEVYAGERADPRTDLYGLGCVLYLAATGVLPFGADNAMGTLQKQLQEGHVPVRELCPSCPDDLVSTIESLLRRERDDRPTSAGEVVAALTTRTAIGAHGPAVVEGRRLHLPPGEHAVIVSEREEDRARRGVLRVDHGKARKTLESEVTKRAQQLWTGVLAYMGVHEPEAASPEQLLLRAVADEAGVDAGDLRQPPAVLQQRFVLVEGITRDAARRIAADARSAGFHARILDDAATGLHPVAIALLAGILALSIPILLVAPPLWFVFVGVALPFVLLVQLAFRTMRTRVADLPVAYGPALDAWLAKPVPGRFAVEGSAPVEQAPAVQVSDPLLARVHASLDALDATLVKLDLPEIVRSDMRDTSRDLRARADELADALGHLRGELAVPVEDTSWVEPRLARLRTKLRAGEAVEPDEIPRLEGLLRQQ
ncbi:MAG: serine/threonine protein kinase, partial [Myxococcales bacterium]|nr:serine/threonine protein kinase [Myxococcales bacterium]